MKLMKNVANRDHSPTKAPPQALRTERRGSAELQYEDRHCDGEDSVDQGLETILREPVCLRPGCVRPTPPDPATWSRALKHRRRRFTRPRWRPFQSSEVHRRSGISGFAVHGDQMLNVSNEASRGHVVLRVWKDRQPQPAGPAANGNEA